MSEPSGPTISFDQEERVGVALLELHPHWSCAECRRRLEPGVSWKPRIHLIGDDAGAYRAVLHLYCGDCNARLHVQ